MKSEQYDVIVCGGGPAGFAAAMSAARNGAEVLLIERNGCLGGIWTAGLLSWILDIRSKKNTGLLKEMFDELGDTGAGRFVRGGIAYACDVEELKHYLEQKCIRAGVHLKYHTMLTDAHVSGKNIDYITTASKSGREKFSARVYVDATGDGDLGAFSGCEYTIGNENGETQPMSLIALIGGIEQDDVRLLNNSLTIEGNNPKKNLLSEMERAGILPTYNQPTMMQYGDDIFALMSNHEYEVSPVDSDEITEATIKARDEIYNTVKKLRAVGGKWKNLRLLATAEQIGVREARRIKGIYCLTEDDLLNGRKFDDAVCDVTNKIDVHAVSAEHGGVMDTGKESKPYQIPLRALISADRDNLLMAGRCISGDFYAHSTYRLTGNAVMTGSAAGEFAAFCANNGNIPAEAKERFKIGT